jgi:PKD repeat protein
VTDSYYLVNLPSPQTTIPLSIRLSQNVSGFFGLEFGAAAVGGPVGNFAQLGVQIDSQPTCTYALLNGTSSFGASGGNGSVSVSVQPGCGWQLSTNVPWIAVSPSAGTGSGGVGFTVAANTGGNRTGRITLSGTNGGTAVFDLAQAGNACSYSVSANSTSLPASASSLNVTVTAGGGCGWSIASLSNFITPGNASGTGTGTTTFNVAGNTASTGRTGTLRVTFAATGATQDISITQAGQTAPPPTAVILNPSSCTVNTACNFDGSRSQGQITDWAWEFGDGTTGSGPLVNHPYATNFIPSFSSRVISVRLTVTGPGGSHSATSTITISRSY